MILSFVALILSPAFAYIPEYSLITSRMAETHGKGAYRIEQDVVIKKEAEAFAVKETWVVTGENNLRVTIEGRGPLRGLVNGSIVYEGSTKAFVDGGSVRNQKLGDEWLEPLFHFRSSKFIRSRLVNLKVTPSESLRDRAPLNFEGDPKYQPVSFIRLSRSGGAITWAIGMPPTVGQSPTLWVEQDQFTLRKFRNMNQTVLRADDYAKFDETFWYPRLRTYEFGGYTVTVQTTKVTPLGGVTAKDAQFRAASLNPTKDALKLPDIEGLRDFFLRFR